MHEAANANVTTPRDIDRLATAALHEATLNNRDRVERDVVQRVLSLDAHYLNT